VFTCLLQDSILLSLSFPDSILSLLSGLLFLFAALVLLLCGMASSSESVGMAYDSITNQIYLTDARK
jgi:hypothetical protein